MQGLEVGGIGRQTIETVAAMLRRIPELDQIGGLRRGAEAEDKSEGGGYTQKASFLCRIGRDAGSAQIRFNAPNWAKIRLRLVT